MYLEYVLSELVYALLASAFTEPNRERVSPPELRIPLESWYT